MTRHDASQPLPAAHRQAWHFAPRSRRSGKRNHAAPELLRVANIDVVFAREAKPAVGCNAKEHETCGGGRNAGRLARRKRHDAGRYQKTAARIDAEGAQLNTVTIDILD